jgi:hypothetical protein
VNLFEVLFMRERLSAEVICSFSGFTNVVHSLSNSIHEMQDNFAVSHLSFIRSSTAQWQ